MPGRVFLSGVPRYCDTSSKFEILIDVLLKIGEFRPPPAVITDGE